MRKTVLATLVTVMAGIAVPGLSHATASAEGLHWGACPAGESAPGLQCSTLRVPLDYAHPEGRTIELAVSRLASAKPSQRHGVLVTNPGGPGGSGLTFPSVLKAAKLPQSVLDNYDIIGFDPRGVGHSTPVTCGLKPEQLGTNTTPPPYARTARDVTVQAASAKKVAQQCTGTSTASLLPYLNTKNTARDMDQIRTALGASKLSYLGYSYGTYLGAVYTTLYPQRSDRIVLDSALGPKGLDITAMRRFGLGFQIRFPDFAKYVAAHPAYHLGSTPATVTSGYQAFVAKLDAKPSPQGYNGALFREYTFAKLYSDSELSTLARAWQNLELNKPIPPEGGPAPDLKTSENEVASRLAVVCNDSSWPKSVGTYRGNVAIDRIRYPLFGAAAANIAPCAFWSVRSSEPPVEIGDQGPANVLIAQNLRDPGTPPVGARELRRAFGARAGMLTSDAGGHGSYVLNGNACTKDAVTGFLLTGKRPSDDFCAAEPATPTAAPQAGGAVG